MGSIIIIVSTCFLMQLGENGPSGTQKKREEESPN